MTTALILIAGCLLVMTAILWSLLRGYMAQGRRQNAAIVRTLKESGMSELDRLAYLQGRGWSYEEIEQAERDNQ